MDKEELLKKCTPRKCETQIEFEGLMTMLHQAKYEAAAPIDDELNELIGIYNNMSKQIEMLKIKMLDNKKKRFQLELKKKENNRHFHELKYKLVTLNPRLINQKDE